MSSAVVLLSWGMKYPALEYGARLHAFVSNFTCFTVTRMTLALSGYNKVAVSREATVLTFSGHLF
jgi:hypothetical protein